MANKADHYMVSYYGYYASKGNYDNANDYIFPNVFGSTSKEIGNTINTDQKVTNAFINIFNINDPFV